MTESNDHTDWAALRCMIKWVCRYKSTKLRCSIYLHDCVHLLSWVVELTLWVKDFCFCWFSRQHPGIITTVDFLLRNSTLGTNLIGGVPYTHRVNCIGLFEVWLQQLDLLFIYCTHECRHLLLHHWIVNCIMHNQSVWTELVYKIVCILPTMQTGAYMWV